MKKDNSYWIEQAKLPAPKGYVCVGKGDNEDPLCQYFKVHSDSSMSGIGLIQSGDCEGWTYYAKVKEWERITNLIFNRQTLDEQNKQNTNMKTLPAKFFVRTPTVEIWNLVQTRIFEFDFTWFDGKRLAQFPTIYGKDSCLGVTFDDDNRLGYSPVSFYKEEGMPEVQIADLFLTDLPKKETVINGLPWSVIIRGDQCDIGCQKNISTQKLVSFVNQINQADFAGGHHFNGLNVDLGRQGVFADGKCIPWETWDKLVKELNRVDKKNSKEIP